MPTPPPPEHAPKMTATATRGTSVRKFMSDPPGWCGVGASLSDGDRDRHRPSSFREKRERRRSGAQAGDAEEVECCRVGLLDRRDRWIGNADRECAAVTLLGAIDDVGLIDADDVGGGTAN